jgi:hypothetical protein
MPQQLAASRIHASKEPASSPKKTRAPAVVMTPPLECPRPICGYFYKNESMSRLQKTRSLQIRQKAMDGADQQSGKLNYLLGCQSARRFAEKL